MFGLFFLCINRQFFKIYSFCLIFFHLRISVGCFKCLRNFLFSGCFFFFTLFFEQSSGFFCLTNLFLLCLIRFSSCSISHGFCIFHTFCIIRIFPFCPLYGLRFTPAISYAICVLQANLFCLFQAKGFFCCETFCLFSG